ncbi:MAG: HigA family addiction module antitoxin [Acidobacteriaceae bacterium]
MHHGEILREEYIKLLGLSVYALTKELKLTRPRLNDIVLERRAITADTAIHLARYFATTAQFWMNMQSSYDLRKTENANRKIVESIAPRRTDAA